MSFSLSSQARTMTRTRVPNLSPTPSDCDDDVIKGYKGLLTHSMLRDVSFPSPQRKMCPFCQPVHLRRGINFNQLSARQQAQMNACNSIPWKSPQGGRGERREGARERVDSRRVWEESVLRMNEEAWERRGGEEMTQLGEKWHSRWGFRSGEAFPEEKLCTVRPES